MKVCRSCGSEECEQLRLTPEEARYLGRSTINVRGALVRPEDHDVVKNLKRRSLVEVTKAESGKLYATPGPGVYSPVNSPGVWRRSSTWRRDQ